MEMHFVMMGLACLGLWLSGESVLAAGPASQPATKPAVPDPTTPVPQFEEGSKLRDGYLLAHKAFCNVAKKGGIDLLFLGDSITQGLTGTGKDVWAKCYKPLHAADFGISGDRTQHILWRVQNGELQGIHPKVVVLLIGTNNFQTDFTDEGVAAGVAADVKAIREKLPQTKVLLLGILPRGDKPALLQHIRNINALSSKLDDGKFVRYLDIGDKFLEKDGSVLKEAMKPDLLHLAPKGYEIWAEAMQSTLEEMMK